MRLYAYACERAAATSPPDSEAARKLRAQGYLPCSGCGKKHPIWDDVVLEEEGNQYRCMASGRMIEYSASDLVDEGDDTVDARNGQE